MTKYASKETKQNVFDIKHVFFCNKGLKTFKSRGNNVRV